MSSSVGTPMKTKMARRSLGLGNGASLARALPGGAAARGQRADRFSPVNQCGTERTARCRNPKPWRSAAAQDLPLLAGRSVPEAELQIVEAAFLNMGDDAKGSQLLQSTAAPLKIQAFDVFVAAGASAHEACCGSFRTAPPEPR